MFADMPPAPPTVDEVVVTAARLPPARGEAAFSVIRLDRENLRTSQRLDEALGAVPAVSLFRRTSSLSANPTTQGVSLRAIAPSGAGRTLVTLDGVPMNDPFGGWVIWSQLPPEALDGLDIVRGSGAGPYGSGALTGVIMLREREAGAMLDVSAAERGGARFAGAGSTRLGGVTLTGMGLYDRTDGYVPVRGPAQGAADTPLDLEALSAAVRADAALGAGVALSARVGVYEEDRGAGLDQARAAASGEVYSVTVARAPSRDHLGWRAQVWRRDSDFSNTSASVAADRSSTTLANDQFATPSTGWGANLALRRAAERMGGVLEWELGADARWADGEVREANRNLGSGFTRLRTAGGETSIAGLYAEGSWSNDAWLLAGGIRLDQWRNAEGRRVEVDTENDVGLLDQTFPDRSGDVFSARLGARRFLGGGYVLRAAAYSGFRPATLNELHRPFRVGNDITEANAALEPETLRGVEAGLGWSGGPARWSATVFWNEIEDAIVNVTIAEGPGTFPPAGFIPAGGVLRQRQNAGLVTAQGLEFEAGWRLDSVELVAAVSATDAEMDGGAAAPQLTGLRPAQAPVWSATAGLDWRAADALTLALRVRYESRRFDDDLNSRELGAAAAVDARIDWRLSDTTGVYAALDNLFDAETPVSMTGGGVEGYGPPRTLRLGLTLRR